ncbi:efflux RND transporter permease subunit [Synoicihabitans lomoniglobus]|uniref:CusA/CzcA family heavy metal efflux RND transporter n=1 Tax=Synoicihabitans lomoniglobus TaxID=2909285 RepID=A0AAF0CMW0_9BACT|nr:CusA/CzcA family heavy metal efflux RND transporter [Opitutaceae bacterium LMO-M01]WED63846.1 CusA/CzcA family heavy metal efflux RND transporter [Opitutaceae bacterium LMO-M01]
MINRLIHWSLHNRFLVVSAFIAVCAWGVVALQRVPIDAIPDLSENQVIVYADWPGRSPQEVEDQISYPLSVNLQGLAGVRTVRASSMFGFSFLTVIFNDDVENYFARTRVLERLNSIGDTLPNGVTARLGPDATGLGWIYQYYLNDQSGTQDLGSLRTLQDTFIRYQLAAVPGVAEVASIGGHVQQFEIEVSSARLRQYDATLGEVLDAVAASNRNVGGKTIEENGAEFVVRGVGLIESIEDLELIPVQARAGTPLLLRDVATVRIGGAFRRGALDVNGREVVGGIVVMRYGENAYQVIQDVKARIAALAKGLPDGLTIEPFYDRSSLIERAIDTLKGALTEEILLVTLAHIIFLFHFRSILIVTLPLPASILISFILMDRFGIPSHIMSLTGIAISIGVLVDAAIVMTENVIRHCEQALAAKREPDAKLTPAEIFDLTLTAAQQVARPIVFSMGIIILAFVPVFLLGGQEGKLFHPLAFTKSFALIGATVLAVTAVPVFCTLLVRGPFRQEDNNVLMRTLLRIYEPVLNAALRHRVVVLGCAVVLLLAALTLSFGLPRAVNARLPDTIARHTQGFGREFMPPLEEGDLLFMPVLLPANSLSEVKRIMAWQDEVMSQHPEVVRVAGKLGRADTATDPAPVEMIETTITLKPKADWRPGVTKQQIVDELSGLLTQVPGYVPGFLMPIENRILMTSTGIRGQVGVKIFGDDLDALQRKAFEIEKVVAAVPGAVGVAPSRVQGKPYLEIRLKREAMARYGLRADNVLQLAEIGIGGTVASTTIKGRERWPIQVRLDAADRLDIETLGDLPLPTPSGAIIRLSQVAEVVRVLGPSEIASENGRLRVFVQANVQDRDLGSFVDEIKQRIEAEITLGPGMTITYAGQYENQLRARNTLRVMVPAVLVIIFLMLTMTFRSAAEAAHVILAVPFALTGGVFLQWWLGYPFSVAVWVGYIALFGTAIQTGVVMVVYLEESVAAARAAHGRELTLPELTTAVVAGAKLRLRPKVMTVATTVASLTPLFWLDRSGVEVMRPIAAPVVGGMISSLLHILIVTPVIFLWLRRPRTRN